MSVFSKPCVLEQVLADELQTRIVADCDARGLDIDQVAKLWGVFPEVASAGFSGGLEMSLEHAVRAAYALGIPLRWEEPEAAARSGARTHQLGPQR